jgi:hypothetical protein
LYVLEIRLLRLRNQLPVLMQLNCLKPRWNEGLESLIDLISTPATGASSFDTLLISHAV